MISSIPCSLCYPSACLFDILVRTHTHTHTHTQRNLVSLLESSVNYLEQAERYELMADVVKLLQPFYDKNRDFKNMMEMYGKLHSAFKKVVDIMGTGRRYLGTYFRIGFYGKV